MRLAVLAETAPGERRVAAVPETVRRLTDAGWEVSVQRGAGRRAYVRDEAYSDAGASVLDDVDGLVRAADVVLSVQPAPLRVLTTLPAGVAVISMLAPGSYDDHLRVCRDRGLLAFALELVPRISRAQAMDVLSSQAMVSGYRATLAAAERLPGFFPMFVTAAGTVPPAKVLVLGVGVAGLQAIATARRLGAVTWAYDVRPASAEEVESLGATFLSLGLATQEDPGGYARVQSEEFLASQRQLLSKHVAAADAVITTAAVPGRRAPLLVTTEMVEQMREGSVLVDLAAETGGNCELTQPGDEVEHRGVRIYGPLNVPSELPRHASEMFARNVGNLLMLMTKEGKFVPDFDDEVVAGCCVTRGGRVVDPIGREADGAVDAVGARQRSVRSGTVDDVALALASSHKVVIVPGYGLAVSQAQHTVRELADMLAERGAAVTFAIHPVAGRMPGHLNVLLDGAEVPHESIEDRERANPGFAHADVVLVVGANDVVNPAARTSPGSPIYGMPILDVDAAPHVVVLKRSMRPGFAGIDNALLHDERTTLLFGDARDTLRGLVTALRRLGLR